MKDAGVYKPLGVGIMMMLLQQFTGINAIMFYAQTIFEQAHFQVGSLNQALNEWVCFSHEFESFP